ncbi:MAG: type II secretion system F family protein [Bacteroidales bacterium]|nr:type II secretion system F family protein [Clostridium sp.]MCM1202599.1 type II secretion system F family protein [Bacteroidales bacterium]
MNKEDDGGDAMAQFNYKAVDKAGKPRKGTIDAADHDKAMEKLKSEGLSVTEIKDAGESGKSFSIGKKKVKSRDLSIVCKQMVSILNAGVTVITALDMLSEQMDNKTLKNALIEAKVYVEKGGTFSDAMRLNPDIFPPIMINMTAAGEASGSMETAFERLSIHFEKDDALKGKIKGALTYPIMVMIVAVLVIIVVMVAVIPNFVDMFADMGTQLPLATRIMMAGSDFVLHKWYILVAVVAALIIGFKAFGASSYGEMLFAKISINAPIFKDLVIKSNSARFARTLSTLMAAGIPMLDSIEQVAKMMGNKIFRDGLMNTKAQVAKGLPLSKPLKDMEVFPTMLVQMVKIGEETGNIEDMMEKVADLYDREVDLATESLTQAMEPLTMVFMAGIVGMIVAAVYGPILSMYQGIDNM